jgi:hypothetical protein
MTMQFITLIAQYTLLTSELFAFKICSKNLIVANCILPLKGYLFNSARWTLRSHSLILKVYSSTAKNSKWLNTGKNWVNKLGFGHLNFHTNNIAFYLTNIKQRIYDHAIHNLNCSIRECFHPILFIFSKKSCLKCA